MAELDLSLANVTGIKREAIMTTHVECDRDGEEPAVMGMKGMVVESDLSLANDDCDPDSEVPETRGRSLWTGGTRNTKAR